MAGAATAERDNLHAHGIDVSPRDFLRLVREAMDRFNQPQLPADARSDLTEPEAEALSRAGFDLEPRARGGDDPLTRTAAEFCALVATCLGTNEAAARLGVDPSRIRQLLTADKPRLYGFQVDSAWRIPEFQLDGDGLLPGLGEVVAALDPQLHPVVVHQWFTTPSPDLHPTRPVDRHLSPREWLRAGFPPSAVVELASQL